MPTTTSSTPRYSWNIDRVGVKHQPINQLPTYFIFILEWSKNYDEYDDKNHDFKGVAAGGYGN